MEKSKVKETISKLTKKNEDISKLKDTYCTTPAKDRCDKKIRQNNKIIEVLSKAFKA